MPKSFPGLRAAARSEASLRRFGDEVHAETIAIGARRLLKPAAFGDIFRHELRGENKSFDSTAPLLKSIPKIRHKWLSYRSSRFLTARQEKCLSLQCAGISVSRRMQ